MILGRISSLLCVQQTEMDGSLTWRQSSFQRNQHNTSSGPPKVAEAKCQRHLRFGRS
ncbi:hypothetical protein E2C01_087013 [Portunus trituberculatus]|uniref:Uncharacterized protein n=1 Tax=Portunus trituberculatus TaxID=210409 RepID=A0A5B7JF11_PORTR|nr:hypothetical protein [Portunus trituberculatus]